MANRINEIPYRPGSGPRRREVRKIISLTFNMSIIFGYLLKSPFGGDRWIVNVNNLKDIIGEHIYN
jgi:photosystem II CP43 chlorophyll apoprotein